MLRIKTIQLATARVKSDPDSRIVEGFAAVYGNIDSQGDMLMPGLFDESIAEKGIKGSKFLRDHSWLRVLGVNRELGDKTADGKAGLFFKSRVSETPLGSETLTLLDDEAIDGVSVGFWIMPGGIKFVPEKESAHGKSYWAIGLGDLMEHSIVPFPANDLARVTDVSKSLVMGHDLATWVAYHQSALAVLTNALLIKGRSLAVELGRRVQSVSKLAGVERDGVVLDLASRLGISGDEMDAVLRGKVESLAPEKIELLSVVMAIETDVLASGGTDQARQAGDACDNVNDVELFNSISAILRATTQRLSK